MTIRECNVSDYERIYELNKNDFGYDYPVNKTKDRLSEVLQRKTDKLFLGHCGYTNRKQQKNFIKIFTE